METEGGEGREREGRRVAGREGKEGKLSCSRTGGGYKSQRKYTGFQKSLRLEVRNKYISSASRYQVLTSQWDNSYLWEGRHNKTGQAKKKMAFIKILSHFSHDVYCFPCCKNIYKKFFESSLLPVHIPVSWSLIALSKTDLRVMLGSRFLEHSWKVLRIPLGSPIHDTCYPTKSQIIHWTHRPP